MRAAERLAQLANEIEEVEFAASPSPTPRELRSPEPIEYTASLIGETRLPYVAQYNLALGEHPVYASLIPDRPITVNIDRIKNDHGHLVFALTAAPPNSVTEGVFLECEGVLEGVWEVQRVQPHGPGILKVTCAHNRNHQQVEIYATRHQAHRLPITVRVKHWMASAVPCFLTKCT
jgi:hypothetical protein